MIEAVMSVFGIKKTYTLEGNDNFASRRSFPRRTCDQCIGFINGKPHPILDWSPGGLRVYADARPINVGQDMDIEMKFHLRDQLVSIRQKATVVRKGQDNVSYSFHPLDEESRATFQNVIDDFNAREFAGSQA